MVTYCPPGIEIKQVSWSHDFYVAISPEKKTCGHYHHTEKHAIDCAEAHGWEWIAFVPKKNRSKTKRAKNPTEPTRQFWNLQGAEQNKEYEKSDRINLGLSKVRNILNKSTSILNKSTGENKMTIRQRTLEAFLKDHPEIKTVRLFWTVQFYSIVPIPEEDTVMIYKGKLIDKTHSLVGTTGQAIQMSRDMDEMLSYLNKYEITSDGCMVAESHHIYDHLGKPIKMPDFNSIYSIELINVVCSDCVRCPNGKFEIDGSVDCSCPKRKDGICTCDDKKGKE